MSSYIKKLSADLPRWVGMGLVTDGNAQAILKDAEAQQGQGWFRLPLILSMLGGILVFAGVISLVASNWDFMPRLLRVAVLLGGMGLAFLSAYYARTKQADGVAHGLAFLGTLIFGANLMLIGQIYHLPPNPPGGTLLWALAASAVALLWPSQLVGALAIFLTGLWSWFAMTVGSRDMFFALFDFHRSTPHLPFLLLWGALTVMAVKRNWTRALHMSGLVLVVWCAFSTFGLWEEASLRLGGLVLAVLLLALYGAGRFLKIARPGCGIISHYLWAGLALWLLFVSIPYMQSELLVKSTFTYLPMMVALATGVSVLALWAVVTDRARPVAAAFLIGALVLLVSLLPVLTGTVGPADYRNYYLWQEAFKGGWNVIALAVLALLAGLGGILHGYRSNDRFFINLGFTVFTLKLLWIYFDTVWRLDGRSMFLMLGGLLVIGLGIFFDRQRRKLIARMNEKGGAS